MFPRYPNAVVLVSLLAVQCFARPFKLPLTIHYRSAPVLFLSHTDCFFHRPERDAFTDCRLPQISTWYGAKRIRDADKLAEYDVVITT